MLDRLRPMAVFAKTAETGSFRAAAKALKLSPSVVSHHVSQLEQQLGVTLIYRTTRKLSLTQHGEILFASSAAMLMAAEGGLNEIAGRSHQPNGHLRITVPAVLVAGHLVEDIGAFSKLYPDVRLDLNFSDVRRDLVADGIDIAIRMGRMENSSLKARKLTVVPESLLASTSYIARRPRPRRPADLEDWDWLHLSSVHRQVRFRNASGATLTVATEPKHRSDDAIALYRLARTGMGLAMVPRFLAKADIEQGLIAEVLPAWKLAPIEVYVVWPSNTRRGSLTTLFVDFLFQCERDRKA
jgi:DNA-binding transcriptional LysR family regulator